MNDDDDPLWNLERIGIHNNISIQKRKRACILYESTFNNKSKKKNTQHRHFHLQFESFFFEQLIEFKSN